MSAKKKTKKTVKKAPAKKKAVKAKKTVKKKEAPAKKVKKEVAKKAIKGRSTPVKKQIKKKASTAKATKPTTSKKVSTKKVAKATSEKKSASKKAISRSSTKASESNTPVSSKKISTKNKKLLEPTVETKPTEVTDARALVLNARKRTSTPAIFKIKARKNTPVLFTLEDVQSIIKKKGEEGDGVSVSSVKKAEVKKKKVNIDFDVPRQNQVFGAASLTDILGYNPKTEKSNDILMKQEASKIPSKYQKYYKALVELRTHFKEGLDFHAQDTLKRSAKDDSGDLSSYGQHMADAGTDSFDRDFALSLVSNEQEALFEIEEAIQRIIEGSYGVCEITGKPIARERLMAVPFTRYSLEGQKELEKQNRRRVVDRPGVFMDASAEDAQFAEDSDD